MKIKLFLILTLSFSLNALENKKVYLAVRNIKYKTFIKPIDLISTYNTINTNICKDLNVLLLNANKYRAKSYIRKGQVVCKKDVEVIQVQQVNFSFGNLEIQKDVEFVKETDKYIQVKTPDGKIEKIYKDGRNR